ncbi:galactosyltransferase-related protein [Dietzia cinnamea]|uniref:glycosyltransferase family 2 protein n=1 Tax=Dietzia cinnamea TaxID=321318 RepID=UPI0021A87D06|nr:galactosyltransferase-related protein [Dietzia cinnamea]MCT1885031.1 galactosyltransferase-related protein [Dietzia cinnamea]
MTTAASIFVVTVCTPGRAEHLRSQRHAMAAHLPGARHVVVLPDRPGSRELVAELSAEDVEIVELPSGPDLPIARSRNLGGDRAAGLGADLIVFLDVDCMPGPELGPRYSEIPGGVVGLGPVTYLPESAGAPDPADLPAFTDPHPARPFPSRGTRRLQPDEFGMFWSLSFAMRPDLWLRLRTDFGGFDEAYTGYGAEDTDFGRRLLHRRVPVILVAGAHAYHRWHPVADPPVDHLADLLRNGAHYAARWGHWPAPGWFEKFEQMGLVRRSGDGWEAVPGASPGGQPRKA